MLLHQLSFLFSIFQTLMTWTHHFILWSCTRENKNWNDLPFPVFIIIFFNDIIRLHSISCSNIRKDTGKIISDYCFICYAVNRLFYISKTKLTLFFVASISARRSLLGKELPVQNVCLSVFILQYFSSSALVFVLPSCFL